MTVCQIKEKYEKRIVKILSDIKEMLIKDYSVSGPDFWNGDDYRWSIYVQHEDEEAIDITFVIAESEEFDGSTGGINFSLDIVREGGEILGGLTPYNYTHECWVSRKDANAVEERFQIMENADMSDISNLL